MEISAFLLEPGRRDLYSAILISVPAISFTGFSKDYSPTPNCHCVPIHGGYAAILVSPILKLVPLI